MAKDKELTKEEKLQAAIDVLNKQFGGGSVMMMSSKSDLDIEVIPTGAIALDLALGAGGLPRGRIVEILGTESSGKTTLAMHVVAEAQKLGGICAYIDVEHAVDPIYARAIGVDVDRLYISQPDTAEQALAILDGLVESGGIDVIVLDSVAALTPRAEIDGEIGDSHVGLKARLMGQSLRVSTGKIAKSGVVAIYINQLREKIGVTYGSNETTPGGRGLRYYASVRLDIRRTENIKLGDEIMGARTKVKVIKNKVAAPHKVAEFDIMYGEGISREGGILDLAVELGIVKKAGAWFSYGDTQVGQGREKSKDFLKENKNICLEIETKVRDLAFI